VSGSASARTSTCSALPRPDSGSPTSSQASSESPRENAQKIYDHLQERLDSPEYAPRALFESFGVEVLRTTDATRFTANVLIEMAGMSVEDGLVMQLHAGSLRNHNRAVHRRFGPDAGADIPVAADWTRGPRALLDERGNDPRFRLVVFGLDGAAYSRELALLAGHYPALLLGAPWWFFDSPLGMRRYLDAVMETAGLYNTASFNDDTRAFASIPSRHAVWRHVTCDWLAGMALTGIVDEEEALDMAREFAYRLAKRAYGFQREPVDRT
jgi:glucuronate isomerase